MKYFTGNLLTMTNICYIIELSFNYCNECFLVFALIKYAVMAQQVEHRLGKAEVPGSSPGNSSIKTPILWAFFITQKSLKNVCILFATYLHINKTNNSLQIASLLFSQKSL